MKDRLDKIIVEKGLTTSRERARALIMEGKVFVGGVPATKAGTMIDPLSVITFKESGIPFVSRGGLKLKGAIEHFKIDLTNKIVMDVGASTGGFTDCMLKAGASKVYAIDVGYGQMDWTLRNDPRVVLIERTNIRYIENNAIPDEIDFASIDVSFISITKVIPKVLEFLKQGGGIAALIKPQFEVGRSDVGKGGIVRDETKRLNSVESLKEFALGIGLKVEGFIESPIKGQKGNVEYLIYLKKE